MDILFYLFAAVAIVTAIQAAIAIWTPRVAWVRMSAVIITALMMPLAYMSFTLLMSKPKPISLEWYERNAPRATVLGVSLDEGRAIYLWLMLDGETEPRRLRDALAATERRTVGRHVERSRPTARRPCAEEAIHPAIRDGEQIAVA
jgi:hypothetical protein